MWVGELYLELHRGTLHQPGQDQAGQPAQRAPAARGRAVGGHRRGPGRLPVPVRSSWTGCGRRCCCTSSTTSCPARPSPGCTARPRATYAAVAGELEEIIAGAQQALVRPGAAPGRRRPGRQHRLQRRAARAATASRPWPPGVPPHLRRAVTGQHLPGGGFVLDNGLLRVVIDDRGLVTSVYDLAAARESARPGRRRQPAPAAPRPAERVGRLGRRPRSTATPSPT